MEMGFIGSVLTICGIALFELGTGSISFATIAIVPQSVSEWLICVGVIISIPLLCDARTNARLAILRVPATFLSAISFSLYLFHYPVNRCLDTIFPRSASLSWTSFGYFMLRVVICLAVVGVFYLVFERNTPIVRRWARTVILERSRAGVQPQRIS